MPRASSRCASGGEPKIRALTLELRNITSSNDLKGPLVTAVTLGSPAKEQGIVVGDVIVEAGALQRLAMRLDTSAD